MNAMSTTCIFTLRHLSTVKGNVTLSTSWNTLSQFDGELVLSSRLVSICTTYFNVKLSYIFPQRCIHSFPLILTISNGIFPPWRSNHEWAKVSSLSSFHDHSRYDSSGRLIGPKHRPLPDNTQHSRETDIHALGWIRNRSSSKRAINCDYFPIYY